MAWYSSKYNCATRSRRTNTYYFSQPRRKRCFRRNFSTYIFVFWSACGTPLLLSFVFLSQHFRSQVVGWGFSVARGDLLHMPIWARCAIRFLHTIVCWYDYLVDVWSSKRDKQEFNLLTDHPDQLAGQVTVWAICGIAEVCVRRIRRRWATDLRFELHSSLLFAEAPLQLGDDATIFREQSCIHAAWSSSRWLSNDMIGPRVIWTTTPADGAAWQVPKMQNILIIIGVKTRPNKAVNIT